MHKNSLIGEAFKEVAILGDGYLGNVVKLARSAYGVQVQQSSLVVIGSRTARVKYFSDFKRWNRRRTIQDLPLGQASMFEAENMEMDRRYDEMIAAGELTYYRVPDNLGTRILIVNDIPDPIQCSVEYNKTGDLLRLGRAAGMLVICGVDSMQEFRLKKWGSNEMANVNLTRLILDESGSVADVQGDNLVAPS